MPPRSRWSRRSCSCRHASWGSANRAAIIDRFATAIFGAIFGAVYGVIFAGIVAWFTDGQFHAQIVYDAAVVYAVLGFLLEAWVGDLIALTMHLVVGLLSGMLMAFSYQVFDPQPQLTGVGRSLFVLGAGAGIVAFLWWQYH